MPEPPMYAHVWISAWQHECCGDAFAIDDIVNWPLTTPDHEWLEPLLGAERTRQINYEEDRHDLSDKLTPKHRGRVRDITLVYARYAPRLLGDVNTLYPGPGTAEFEHAVQVDRWAPERPNLTFSGYIVELHLFTT